MFSANRQHTIRLTIYSLGIKGYPISRVVGAVLQRYTIDSIVLIIL
jgi:hypothetical protein